MALNVAKTESMVICTRPKLARLQGQRIQITHNGTAIKSVDSHKLLCHLPELVGDESPWDRKIPVTKTLVLF